MERIERDLQETSRESSYRDDERCSSVKEVPAKQSALMESLVWRNPRYKSVMTNSLE